jgi:phospholipid/cholesterol/gamma-HCH transport system ATP-binding protein
MSGAPDIAIRVRGLKTAFGRHVVHEDLDLDVLRGEVLGVIGPSGGGKSVLLKAIVGLITPAAGQIEWLGEPMSGTSREAHDRRARTVGVMFQDGALFSSLSVRENVMLPLREHAPHLPVDFMRALAGMKVVLAGLETDAADKRPADLSGGMRKRAALARALALDPSLLFLDEPTAGLDPITAGHFDALLRELARTLGLTVFLVTHDLDTLAAVCDRIAVVGERRILCVDTPDAVRAVAHPWIQEYFSGPRGRAAFTRKD